MKYNKKRISPLEALQQTFQSFQFNIGENFEVLAEGEQPTRIDEKKYISWEKWKDPYGDDWEGEELEEMGLEDGSLDRGFKAIPTVIGLIPHLDEFSAAKVFNFWIGYTNFEITNKVVAIIEDIEGVEILNVFTRYRFRIGVGKLFKDNEVIDRINHRMNKYLELKNGKRTCQLNLSGELLHKKVI